MPFHFRLEASLKLAEKISEEAQRQLAKETQKWLAMRQAYEEQQEIWLSALEGQRQAGRADPDNLGRWQAYGRLQHQILLRKETDLQAQERIKEERRLQVLQAHQELEKLKRLRERQAKAFVLAEQRKEQKVLDEAGQVLYQQRRLS